MELVVGGFWKGGQKNSGNLKKQILLVDVLEGCETNSGKFTPTRPDLLGTSDVLEDVSPPSNPIIFQGTR